MAKEKTKGSPSGEPLYLSVGFLRRPHGVAGEIIMDLHTDFPDRMKKGRKIFVGDDYKPMTLESSRTHQSGLLVKFQGVNSPETAGLLRNMWVYVKTKDVPLPEGQHYQHELIGMKLVDDAGNHLGELTEILETGANEVFVVQDEYGKEILLPNIPSVILGLDFDQHLIKVHLLEGL